MGTRGRKSSAELQVVGEQAVEPTQYPTPPEELNSDQRKEWDAIVQRLPADWFPRETHGTLIQLCRHRARARRIAQLIEAYELCEEEEFDPKEYRDLLKAEADTTKTIQSCETKLRLSPQSTQDPKSAGRSKRPKSGSKPWES